MSLFLILLLFSQETTASLNGKVVDGETRLPLELAHVRVIGTNIGTTTNSDGSFKLVLQRGSYQIHISYLGHRPETLHLEMKADTILPDILLQPTPIFLSEVTVHPRKYTEAEEIVLEAIREKANVLKDLRAYTFDAYTKTIIKVIRKGKGSKLDTSIGGILETKTKGYWRYPDNYKEIIEARRQTANFSKEYNRYTAYRIPNFNEDEILIDRFSVPGPISKHALRYYSYEIIDSFSINGRKIVRLQVKAKSQKIPLFEGTIDIDEVSYLVAAVNLKGNPALFSPPFLYNYRIKQEFSLYEEKFWLPILTKITMDIFPPFLPKKTGKIVLVKNTVMTNYVVNPELSGEFFDQNVLIISKEADRVDSTAWKEFQVIPLTPEEKRAYWEIDSMMRRANFFQKLMTSLIRFKLWWSRSPLTSFSDLFHFNRVEGPYTGLGLELPKSKKSKITLKGGYGLSDRSLKYEVGLVKTFGKGGRFSFESRLRKLITKRGDEVGFSPGEITVSCLLYKIDPEDYYENTAMEFSSTLRISPYLSFGIGFANEYHRSVGKNTDFSIFYREKAYRENPPINDGKLKSMRFSISFDTRRFLNLGLFSIQEEGRNYWRCSLAGEYTNKNILKSDFEYTRIYVSVQRYQHLFASTLLDLSIGLGISRGGLPYQKMFVVKSSSGGLAPKGVLRTVGVGEFEGDRILTVALSYNLLGLPFQLLKVPILNRSGLDFILYFGMGSTWVREQNRKLPNGRVLPLSTSLYEAGFGLGKLLGIFTVNFTWGLGKRRAFYISLGTM